MNDADVQSCWFDDHFIALFVQKDILFYSDLIKTLWLFYTKKNDVIVKIIVS